MAETAALSPRSLPQSSTGRFEVSNVLARFAGREPGKSVLMMAHYDSVPAGPGASDDLSGVATLLEVARVLKAGPPLRHGVLFLLDELLSGTNSHDRLDGARGILRGLLDRTAIGLATTHDLALTAMVEGLGDRAANVHFEDRLEEGKIVFDYRLRPGVVEKSNALDLMRAVGLDV